MLARWREHKLAPVRGVEADRRFVRLRPLPACAEVLAGKIVEEGIFLLRLGDAQRRWRDRARPLAVVDRRPAVVAKFDFVEQHFATGVNKCFDVVGVIEQKMAAALVGHDAAMAGTLPVFVAAQNRVGGIFLPRTGQRTRTGNTQRVSAATTAATRTRVEQIEPITTPQNKRALDNRALPWNVVADEFSHFADEFRAVAGKLLRPNDGRPLSAVPVLLPDEPTFVLLHCHRHRVDGPVLLRHQRAVIGVGSFRLVRSGNRHAERTVLFATDVINKVAALVFRNFRRPEIGDRPRRPLRKDRPDDFPVY